MFLLPSSLTPLPPLLQFSFLPQKLLLFFFEIVEKTNGVDASGKPQIIPEFILCGNAWQQDLNHPNEYVRGATLRFVCKLREEDLLEPLVPSMRTCLEHRHSCVPFFCC